MSSVRATSTRWAFRCCVVASLASRTERRRGQSSSSTNVWPRCSGRTRTRSARSCPLGPPGSPLAEIVGIVKDVKYRDLREDAGPMLYFPVFQRRSTDAMTLHVRAASDPSALAGTIRREMQALDAKLPVFGVRTLEDQLDGSFAQTRQAAVLTGGFRHPGAAAERDRRVRRHRVGGQPPDARHRHPNGTWCPAPPNRPHDGRRGIALVAAGLGWGCSVRSASPTSPQPCCTA